MACPRCSAPATDETLKEFGGVCPKCLLDFSEEKDAPAFPNLEIVEMLGQGGMGVVYRAVQKNLGRTVALKILSPQLLDDPEFVERFTREARALASLSHPNIVGIYDSGIHDHVPYLVMEFVDGTPLRKLLSQNKLSPGRALEVIPQICDALHYAHAHGVVHRDIKPENILINREGQVKIADFGLAKLASQEEMGITRTGYVMGSPRYMAPEQFEGKGRVDHRADIYSLGVVFYEMLTGEVPMGRFKPPSEKAPVDQRLDPVVLRSLEREPEDRWQTVDEVKQRLVGLEGVGIQGSSDERTLTIVLMIFLAFAVALEALVLFMNFDDSVPSGPSLVMVAGVSFLIVLVGLSRRRRSKRIERPRAARRRAFPVGAGVGVAVFLVLVLLLLVRSGTSRSSSPPMPPAPVVRPLPRPVPQRGKSSRREPQRHVVREGFKLGDVFPKDVEFPRDFENLQVFKGEEAIEVLHLPPALGREVEVRVFRFDDGRVILAGLEFGNEASRRRWQTQPAWQEAVGTSDYSLTGESESALLIWNDGSKDGEAASETLSRIVETKWAVQAVHRGITRDP